MFMVVLMFQSTNYDSTVNVDNGTCIVSECPTLEFVETFDNGLSPLWFNGR